MPAATEIERDPALAAPAFQIHDLIERHVATKHSLIRRHCLGAARHISRAYINGYGKVTEGKRSGEPRTPGAPGWPPPPRSADVKPSRSTRALARSQDRSARRDARGCSRRSGPRPRAPPPPRER